MKAITLVTTAGSNPELDYVAHREAGRDRRVADFFAKLTGCRKGLKSWATGTGKTAEAALEDALKAWESEGMVQKVIDKSRSLKAESELA